MFWMTRKQPDKIPGYFLCTIQWGKDTRLTHEYYWGADKRGKFRWWTSKTAWELKLIDGGFSEAGFEIVAWQKMPEPYRGVVENGSFKRDRPGKDRRDVSGHRASEGRDKHRRSDQTNN